MSTVALPTLRSQSALHGASRVTTLFRLACVVITLGFVVVFLVLPLMSVFYEALKPLKHVGDDDVATSALGWYWASLKDPNSLHALKMTLLVTAIALPFNTIFGVASAWAIAKFDFRGKTFLTTIIDIPFAVSPVISGMVFVLLFGRQGLLGDWLANVYFHYPWYFSGATIDGHFAPAHFGWAHQHGLRIIFAVPGMVLATIFVTFPFVARELIPLMQEQGTQEEQAAISLGANGWQTFWRVTLPNIKWGLLYGVILCNARAMGEFGAVSVVTQNLPGETNTLPREIEFLYSSYSGLGLRGAFALSSLLAMLGLVTLIAKSFLEWKIRKDLQQSNEVLS